MTRVPNELKEWVFEGLTSSQRFYLTDREYKRLEKCPLYTEKDVITAIKNLKED